jgi:hypothetical protein
VVSSDLYCESAAGEWSGIADAQPVLVATYRGRNYTASGALLRCMSDAHLRGLLVPQEALRDSIADGLRRRTSLLRRTGRSLRLVRMRFRQEGRMRGVIANIALVAVFLVSIVTLTLASGEALEARASLSGAQRAHAELAERTASLARLRDEAGRLQADGAERSPAPPGRTISALVSALVPGERITSVAVDGFDMTLVVEGGLDLVARIDALHRVRTTGHTLTERDGAPVITIRAEQEGTHR